MKASTLFHIIVALFAQTVLANDHEDIEDPTNASLPELKEVDIKLLKACTSGRGIDNVDDVKAALEKGADINIKEAGSGQTCFMASCLRGKVNIVKYLLTAGADTSIPEAMGYTPPHGAAFQGRDDVMKVLIEAGLDVNKPHDDGFVPLHRACWGDEERHAETLRVLLNHGVPYDVKNTNDGSTCAEMTGSIHILKVLEEKTGKKFIEDGDEEFFEEDDDDDDDDDDYEYIYEDDDEDEDMNDDDDEDGNDQKQEL